MMIKNKKTSLQLNSKNFKLSHIKKKSNHSQLNQISNNNIYLPLLKKIEKKIQIKKILF